jgi:RNA polymerase sigma-70 factor, ECF subfamily
LGAEAVLVCEEEIMNSLVAGVWRQCEAEGSETLRRAEEAEGDAGFAALVERQARFIYRVAYAVLRNVQDAEDVVQEAFLKLYRTGAWRGMEEEKAYLARVAWRMAVERLPRRDEVDEGEETVDGGASPEADAIRSADEARLRRLIASLPEELRQPLVLCALEEMNSREVGLVMGIPEGTVRTRLMRAKAELKARYLAEEEVAR